MCAGQEALLDEDLEGDALDEELAPVALQLALAASKLGRRSEASAAYQVRQHARPCSLHLAAPCKL